MRAHARNPRALMSAALVALAASTLLVGCNDSNDVAGPGPVGVVADVSGNWSGQYASNIPSFCTNGAASATFNQTGSEVRGWFRAPGCQIEGAFLGTVSGDVLTGTVSMVGCTGGGVSGRLESGSLSLVVGDFHKDLISGDQELMPGGQVRLQR